MKIIIKAGSSNEMGLIKDALHDILVGNTDYIENKIILNGSDDRLDGSVNEVHLLINKEI